MLNKFFIMGRLTRNPELRHTPNGRVVANFAIAHELSFKDSDGNKITEFYDIVAWNNTAEFATKFLDKGRQVVISGSGRMKTFCDREGCRRTKFEIHADEIYFADGGAKKNVEEESPSERHTASALQDEGNFSDWEELYGEEVEGPF